MNPEHLREFVLRLHTGSNFLTDTVGSAVVAPVFDAARPEAVFAITAWHVVAGEVAARRKVFATRRGSETVECSVVATDRNDDLAILNLHGSPRWPPLLCTNYLATENPVVLCGHPVGFTTFGSEALGELRGIQVDLEDGSRVIEVVSAEIAASVRPATEQHPGKSPRDYWRGLSGGAAVITPGEAGTTPFAVGIVKRVSEDGVAGRVYCVPMDRAAALCSRNRLCLDLSDVRPLIDIAPTILFGSICSNLDDPRREQYAWDHISNLFFARENVEGLIRTAVNSPRASGISPADVPFLHYFWGRLSLKTGNYPAAAKHFQDAEHAAARAGGSAALRLRALIRARILADEAHSGPWKSRLRTLQQARNTLEGLRGAPDSYISAELASLIGWECEGLFKVAPELPPDAITALQTLVADHERLLVRDQVSAPKQLVVSTAMKVLGTVWGYSPAADIAGALRQLAAKASVQATTRRNSIFYIQSVLMDAVAAVVDNDDSAVSKLMFVGDLLRRHHLTVMHEGIAQLLVFLASRTPSMAELITTWTTRPAVLDPRSNLAVLAQLGIDRAVAAEALLQSTHWLNEVQKHRVIYECDARLLMQ